MIDVINGKDGRLNGFDELVLVLVDGVGFPDRLDGSKDGTGGGLECEFLDRLREKCLA